MPVACKKKLVSRQWIFLGNLITCKSHTLAIKPFLVLGQFRYTPAGGGTVPLEFRSLFIGVRRGRGALCPVRRLRSASFLNGSTMSSITVSTSNFDVDAFHSAGLGAGASELCSATLPSRSSVPGQIFGRRKF